MITFSYPAGNASFPRSYITRVFLEDDPGVLSVADHTMTLTIAGYPHYVHRFVINEKLFAWNSNTYSLDYFFTDGWYEFDDSSHHDFGATLELVPVPLEGFWAVRVSVPGSAGLEHVLNLEGPPPGYWLATA